jgi:hypothetical protein
MRKIVARTVMTAVTALVIAAVGAGTATAAGSAKVTNSQDAGPGSFRAAIEKASLDPSIGRIEFRSGLSPIMLASPVVYTGGQTLDVVGNGAVIDGSGLDAAALAAFLANTAGNLSVSRLTVRNAPQEGLVYQVPATATGTKKVTLLGVQIVGNDGHGVLINDQVSPDDVANPNGSEASLDVSVIGSRFADNGFGALDRDGLRVNEGGNGNLKILVSLTRADHNGADGIELDERSVGDVVFNVSLSEITGNGSFDVTLADLDDGMDVDESDDGALIGKVVASSANDNFEEGWDFNENDAGDFRVEMTLVEASRNLEEGIDFEEDDDFQGGGDLITTVVGIKADGNGPGGDAGLKIRERGDGNIDATVRGAQTNGNLAGGINVREQGIGDLLARIERTMATANGLDGISLREDDDGSLTATVDRSIAGGNTGDGIELEENSTGNLTATVDRSTTDGNTEDGVELDENGAGNLTGTVRRGSSSNNSVGVRADQQVSAGDVGTLNLIAMTLGGNTTAPVVSNADVTVTQS